MSNCTFYCTPDGTLTKDIEGKHTLDGTEFSNKLSQYNTGNAEKPTSKKEKQANAL